jgi:hypothetical protein
LPSSDDLHEEVRRRERANVTAQAKQDVGRSPSSIQSSLSDRHQQSSYGSARGSSHRDDSFRNEKRSSHSPPAQESTAKKRSPSEIAAQQEKKRKLMAKYG